MKTTPDVSGTDSCRVVFVCPMCRLTRTLRTLSIISPTAPAACSSSSQTRGLSLPRTPPTTRPMLRKPPCCITTSSPVRPAGQTHPPARRSRLDQAADGGVLLGISSTFWLVCKMVNQTLTLASPLVVAPKVQHQPADGHEVALGPLWVPLTIIQASIVYLKYSTTIK